MRFTGSCDSRDFDSFAKTAGVEISNIQRYDDWGNAFLIEIVVTNSTGSINVTSARVGAVSQDDIIYSVQFNQGRVARSTVRFRKNQASSEK